MPRQSRKSRAQLAVVAALLLVATAVSALAVLSVWKTPRAQSLGLAGRWTGGGGWGVVVLERRPSGGFEGTYSSTYGRDVGRITLQWIPERGHYEGEWSEGTYRFGKVIVEPPGDGTARGEYSADAGCELNPGIPASEEFRWERQGEQ